MAYEVVNERTEGKTEFIINPNIAKKDVYIVHANNQASAIDRMTTYFIDNKIKKFFITEKAAQELGEENVLLIRGYKYDSTRMTVNEKGKKRSSSYNKKADFSWTEERTIQVIEISDTEQRMVKMCLLETEEEDKWYVCFTTIKLIKEVWKPVKGYTIPLEHWWGVTEAVESACE